MFYKFARGLMIVIYKLLYRYKVYGRENVPQGSLLVCANHTGLSDPIFAGIAMDTRTKVRFMAKAELFKFRPLGAILRWLGAFPVNRGSADIGAIKLSLRAISAGERMIMFPEGTRNSDNGAKAGAGMLALRTGCDILPIYISPDKKPFAKVNVAVGKPFKAEKPEGKPAAEQYRLAADEILRRIYALEGSWEKTENNKN